jgi:hypothetical protein
MAKKLLILITEIRKVKVKGLSNDSARQLK